MALPSSNVSSRAAQSDAAEERRTEWQRTHGGRKPRVVYLGHVAKLSGAELALLRLLPAVDGVDRHVIVAEDGPLVGRFQQEGITAEVMPIAARTASLRKESVRFGLPLRSLSDTVAYARRLSRRITELDADIVHTNSLKAHFYGGLAARLAGVPQVWHTRDRVAPDYLPMPAVRLVRFAVRHLPAAVLANSAATLETLKLQRGLRRVLANPVVMADRVLPSERRRSGAAFTVGVVGRLAPWKGQDVFLRAFAQAFPAGSERAVIIGSAMFGEDEYAASLSKLAVELGVADRVDFLGFVDDVPGRLAQLDALVHCSTIPEPFGQVVVEGMAAGLPVIAARAGGPAEIIADGSTGLLTPMGDVAALAAALHSVAADPAFAARLGAAAWTESRRYRADSIARQLTDLYYEVLQPTASIAAPRASTRAMTSATSNA